MKTWDEAKRKLISTERWNTYKHWAELCQKFGSLNVTIPAVDVEGQVREMPLNDIDPLTDVHEYKCAVTTPPQREWERDGISMAEAERCPQSFTKTIMRIPYRVPLTDLL